MVRITRRSSVRSSRLRVASMAAVVSAALALVIANVATAAGTVSQLIFNPSPIGTETTVAAGSSVLVTLTAKDSLNNPVPGGSVFLSFSQASGGGTAFVGTKGLAVKPQLFVADSTGKVMTTYTAPPSYPTSGCDVVKAQNGPTRATSTVVNTDAFCFSPITSLGFTPKPLARKGSLGASSHVTVTLTVFGSNGSRLANGTVWVTFKPASATAGESASVNGVALAKGFATAETTNASGQVFILYSTGTVLPASPASDKLIAGNAPKLGTITATDSYQY